MINIKPQILFRNEEHYVSINNKLKREEIPSELPPLIPELFSWLKKKMIKPEGAPFFSYKKMNHEHIEVDVGIPVSSPIEGDDRIIPGAFPEGKYAMVKYTGPYNRLFDVHTEIEKWKDENHLKFVSPKVEFYPSDPAAELNPEKWETIIINRIDDSKNF